MPDSQPPSIYISHFEAPKGRSIIPAKIQPGVEYIELLTGGKILFKLDGVRDVVFGRGAMFWHLPGDFTVYRYPPGEPYSCYVFRFSGENLKRPGGRISCPASSERLLDFASEMFRFYHSAQTLNSAFLPMVYSTLAWYALGPQVMPGSENPPALSAALRFLEKNVGSNLSLEDVAASANMSLPYLFVLFKRHMETSPHKYLLKLRIAKAKQLLAGGNLSIKETAVECGFDSIEVFYRQFAKSTGLTPAGYRKKYQPQENAPQHAESGK